MGEVAVKLNNFRTKENAICPICKSSRTVGRVFTTKSFKNNNVCTRNFCRNCLVEFDSNGIMYPPLYE